MKEESVQAGRLGRVQGVLAESVAELKKVSAPTRREALQETFRALALVVFFAVMLAICDWLFKWIVWRLV